VRRHENNQFLLGFGHRLCAESRPNERQFAKHGHLGNGGRDIVLNQTANYEGLAVFQFNRRMHALGSPAGHNRSLNGSAEGLI
jgi:hypothetical protein